MAFPHCDENDIAHLIECAQCRELYRSSSHTVWVMGGMEGPCPLCGEESGFHDDDGTCHAPDTVDDTIAKPPLLPCDLHPACAIDPISGDHVNTNTGVRRAVRFRVRWRKLGGHYHCRLFQLIEPSSTWQKCGELTFDEGCWVAFKMGDFEVLSEDE